MATHIDDGEMNSAASRESHDGLVDIAKKVEALATATAPTETGLFGTGFTQAGTVVSNSTEGAFYIEFGTSDTPAHMTLVNAASAFGDYHGYTSRGRPTA